MKRKGKHILSSSTKKARGQVVHNLAVQVHELQAEEAVALESRTDGSSFGSKKYGSIKRIIADAVRVYPWMDRNKVYNGIKAIKKRRDKQLPPDDVPAPARVLQLSTVQNQHHDEDDASRKKSGRPKGSTAMARLRLEEKRKKAIDLVTTRYQQECNS